MRTMIAVSPKTVFIKSSKGREEISQRQHGLTPSQRRVLIVIDGQKSFDELKQVISAVIPYHELEQILFSLIQEGFIVAGKDSAMKPKLVAHELLAKADSQPAEKTLHVAPPILASASQASQGSGLMLTQDAAMLRQVKDFMATTAHTYLGLLSADVIRRIEHSRNAEQLMSVVGHWHMALRDSKHGKRFAEPYLEQVKTSLAGGKSVLNAEYLTA
jgi:hypothetical protein